MRLRRVGYDYQATFRPEELAAMYIGEGKTPNEANQLAESLSREMNHMVSNERYSWKKCRKAEVTGIDMDEFPGDVI